MSRGGRVPTMFLVISLTLVLLVCVGMRYFRAFNLPLWADEILTIRVAEQNDLESWLSYQIYDANPPLSYLVLKLWLSFVGDVKYMRLLPIMFSVATVLVLFFVGRALGGFWIAIFATAIFAIHPFAVYYGREPRHPSITSFLALLLFWVFYRLWKKPRFVFFALYFVLASLLIWTHYYGAFLALAHLLALFIVLKDKRVEVLALGVAIALAFLPWLGVVELQWIHGQPRESLPLVFEGILLWVFYTLGGSEWEPAAIPVIGLSFAQPKYFLALFILTLPVLIAFILGVIRRELLPLTLSLLVPTVLALIVSAFLPVFRPKYFFMLFPFFCLLVAAGLFRRDGRFRGWLGWPMFIVLALSAMQVYYAPEFERERWNEVAKLVRKNEDMKCAVVFYSYYPGAEAFSYYYRGKCAVETLSYSLAPQRFSDSTIENWVSRLAQNYELVWLVDYLPHIYDPGGRIKEALLERFHEIDFLGLRTRRLNALALVASDDVWMQFFSSRINFTRGGFLKTQLLEGVQTGGRGNPVWFDRRARILLRYTNQDFLYIKLLPPFDILPGQKLGVKVKVEGDMIVDTVLDRTKSSFIASFLPRKYPKQLIEVEVTFDRSIRLRDGTEAEKSSMVYSMGLMTMGCEVCDEARFCSGKAPR